MIRSSKLVALMAGTAMIALQSAPAVAEGTSAGTQITNTATINYRVGGVDQTVVTASDTFSVDRKINLVVTNANASPTNVVPGQTDAVLAFDITNLSNAVIDIAPVMNELDSGTQNLRLFRDNGNSVFDAGDTPVVTLDEVSADTTVRVFIVVNVQSTQPNGSVVRFVLDAQAFEGGTPGSRGALVAASTGPDTDGVETVLADTAGVTDQANDGMHSAEGSFITTAATLTVNKTSRVLSDPINNTADPKAIPGALVEYCIAVSNAAGSAAASNIVVTDILPADLTFVGPFGIRVDGALDGSGNCTGGVAGGAIAARTISAPLSDVAAGQTRTVFFRATIN